MNRTKFIGKEKDKESNYADHGVRKYDDEIGRFTSIDPLWEKYYSLTPYQYAGNNPVSFLDGNGLNWFRNQSTGEIKWYDQTGDFSSAQTYETWEDLGVNLIYFDGSSLTMYKEDKTSKSFPAVSGELEEGKTKPENQLEQGGPIPEGSHYKVDPKDIQKWSSLSTWQQIISIISQI